MTEHVDVDGERNRSDKKLIEFVTVYFEEGYASDEPGKDWYSYVTGLIESEGVKAGDVQFMEGYATAKGWMEPEREKLEEEYEPEPMF